MDNSNNDQVFHSSNIANQTLAGSAVDPFTLTDKEKKRQEKQVELNDKRMRRAAMRAAKKAARATKIAALKERLSHWRKSNPLLFIVSATALSALTVAGLLGASWLIVSNLTKKNSSTVVVNNVDPTDPISVNCNCAKGSQTYNDLKEDYELAKKHNQEVLSNFDAKTATPFQTNQFIDTVIGMNYLEDAYDSSGNLNVIKALDNINHRIESAKITDEDQKAILEIYSFSIYNKAKQYNQTLEKLYNYYPDNMYNSGKYIYYIIAYEAYHGLGYEDKAKEISDKINSIPYGEGSF